MDPLLPDADRYAVTAGFGWKLAKNLALDAIPDLSDTQVIIYSRWDRSPEKDSKDQPHSIRHYAHCLCDSG
jgi:hypothetical protein